ncbi:group III truncated hemoglobin [Fulvivirga lutea]|uniref:Group III truncated hemoglobin n=1 Tax=Fulvivirga lutea TaxID=2810512 RepID=A0A974WJ25_9BACT|nr:group III truncated hemoglobin [Fulvivirga lutea]QSE98839.1 group III truncated hemoglobin [Fulvivirga lutea]
MRDIENREDIENLMTQFYTKVLNDKTIGYIFTDIAQIDLTEHLPIICDFWETIILHNQAYKKDVMAIHLDLNSKVTLTTDHFKQWLYLFNETVEANYSGSNADLIKIRAQSIATVMQVKLKQSM